MRPHPRLRLPALAAAAAVCVGGVAQAHERWVHHRLLQPYDRSYFEEPRVATVLVGALLLTGLLGVLLLSRRWRPQPPNVLLRLTKLAPAVLRISYGATLLMFARRGAFIAPDLRIDGSPEGRILAGTTAVVGILLTFGFHVREAALVSLLAFFYAMWALPFAPFNGIEIGVIDVLAYLEVVGIAAYLVVAGRDVTERSQRPRYDLQRVVGLSILRVLFGATLVFLGAAKFVVPDLFMGVVQNHPQIFLEPFAPLGLPPEVIVLGASAVEVGLGTLTLLGVYTRVVMLGLGSIFLATAIGFRHELLGHLPLLGVVFVLFVEGGGKLADIRRERRLAENEPEEALPRFTRRGLVGVALGALLVGLSFGETAPPADVLDAQRAAAARERVALGLPTEPETPLPDARLLGERGRFRFHVAFEPPVVRLNELFRLRTELFDPRTGAPVDGLDLAIDVSMPTHGHGMPTRAITSRTEAGFVTEGCQFNMFGPWQVQAFVLDAGTVVDLVTLPYDFQPHSPAPEIAAR